MLAKLKNQDDYREEIREKARTRRLELNLTQSGLAKRSGVSLGSVKRFESTGEISLSSLLDIALALGCLEDFEMLFQQKAGRQIDLFSNTKSSKPKRKRGTKQ